MKKKTTKKDKTPTWPEGIELQLMKKYKFDGVVLFGYQKSKGVSVSVKVHNDAQTVTNVCSAIQQTNKRLMDSNPQAGIMVMLKELGNVLGEVEKKPEQKKLKGKSK